MSDDIEFVDEFIRGTQDCANGVVADENGGEDYISGYSTQHQHEQNITEMYGHDY